MAPRTRTRSCWTSPSARSTASASMVLRRVAGKASTTAPSPGAPAIRSRRRRRFSRGRDSTQGRSWFQAALTGATRRQTRTSVRAPGQRVARASDSACRRPGGHRVHEPNRQRRAAPSRTAAQPAAGSHSASTASPVRRGLSRGARVPATRQRCSPIQGRIEI